VNCCEQQCLKISKHWPRETNVEACKPKHNGWKDG